MKLTKKKFFELLPQTRYFNPRVQKDGCIRFNGGMCPITAVYRWETGKTIKAGEWDDIFDEYDSPQWAADVVDAADDEGEQFKSLRAKLLKSLDLQERN